MKKYFFSIITIILLIFTSNVFASNVVSGIEIMSLDYPKLGEAVDTTAKVRGSKFYISKIVWYKDGYKMSNNVFAEEGIYICRIYFNASSGYTFDPSSLVIFANTENRKLVSDFEGYYIELTYNVSKEIPEPPKSIYFFNMDIPKTGGTFDYDLEPRDPDYYNDTKIEWYDSSNNLLSSSYRATSGVYFCRVYIELYNDFQITSNIKAQITSKAADKIVKDYHGTYIEVKYTIGSNQDPKCVSEMKLIVDSVPSYGQTLKNVNVKKRYASEYYEISKVEWYCNNYRMIDDYFFEGVYKCRIFINFINGGYPVTETGIYINDSTRPKKLAIMDNQFYVEETFDIKKYVISTLKFDGLNIPEYGSVQDIKVQSLEPGIYSPSMVYWYDKNGRYLSNIEIFDEGKYTCKFTISLNVECDMKSTINALINNSEAKAYIENGKITIEKTYEIEKPNKKWSKASEWAVPELNDALNYALIPTSLENKDFTSNISRAEFAAVAVRMYEKVSMKSAEPTNKNPFSDTNDSEILKAYALGITNGTSETTFEPNSLITRQEMATMMVRALSKAGVSITVNLNKVNKFADHNKIDSWALNGVYFMSNIGIIKGKGNNTFDVLGNATREEALAISIRSVNYYK